MSFTAAGYSKASTRVRQSKFSDFALSSFLACILAAGPSAYALPAGGVVTGGSGTISQAGAVTTINQSSARLGLNWNSFNIGAAETVNFVQPSASSVAVNRIHDVNGTQILGKLNANGQVFLINPNGVLFGAGSQVNVGGLVASTLDLAADGKTFSGAGGSVVNQGTLTAADGGYIALLGGSVSNQGVITARLGTVALGAGNQVTLDFSGDRLVSLTVDSNTVAALTENKQLIRADGGMVLMSAGARDSLIASVVNNTGVVQAQTIENYKGVIKLLGGMKAGTTTVAGILDASAPTAGNGGFIETSAAKVTVADSAKITTRAASGKTGTWLIDPVDFTIAASGGDITGTALSTLLADNNVPIEAASGNLNVNDAVSWSADTTLTLTALGSIIFNAPLTATGDHAGLVLSYGSGAGYVLNGHAITLSGAAPTLQIGETGSLVTYTVINSLGAEGSTTGTDLQGMNGDLAGHYALGSNIDASGTVDWNTGAGFAPVGSDDSRFNGAFEGLGHTITGLTINRPDSDNVGLFGFIEGSAVVQNIGLINNLIVGGSTVGGLVGFSSSGTITNAYATGSVSGSGDYVGGLVGYNDSGTITNAYATGSVSGSGDSVGGLVGVNYGAITNAYATDLVSGNNYVGDLVGLNNGTITSAYATGSVSGHDYVGGLVGLSYGAITNAYATDLVSGNNYVGGLVAVNGGTITNAYATGSVSGSGDYVGGLVAVNYGGTITNAYATGSVSGSGDYVGGLVGTNNGGTVTNTYATGAVSGTGDAVGGLVGDNEGTITVSFWDTDTTGQVSGVGSGDSSGAHGLTTAEFQDTYGFLIATDKAADSDENADVWDFETIWAPSSSGYYPQLYALTPVVFDYVNDASKTYGQENPEFQAINSGGPSLYVFGPKADYLAPVSGDISTSATASSNVGSYAISPGVPANVTSARGVIYRVVSVGGMLEVNPVSLTVTADSNGKIYGDPTPTLTYSITSGALVGADQLTGALAVSDGGVNVDNYAIVRGSLTAGSNYSLSFNGADYVITARPITVTANNQTGTKGKDLPALTFAVTTGNLVGEDSLNGALATTGTSESAAGDYAITQGDLSAGANYEVTFVDGVLTIDAPANTSSSQVATFEQQRQPGDGHGRGGISLGGFDSDVSNNLAFQNLGMTLPSGLDDDKNK